MDEFWGKMRSRAGQAAFEAEKIRQITALQLKIRTVRQQTQQAAYQAGMVAYQLYREGQNIPPISWQACAALDALEAHIIACEQEIEQIRAQQYVAPVATPGMVCPQGHGPLFAGDVYCQRCGARGVMPAANLCPHCYATLSPNAKFCTVCGNIVAPPTTSLCPECQQPASPNAFFCTHCGFDLRAPAAPPPVESPAPPAQQPEPGDSQLSGSESWLNTLPIITPPPPQSTPETAILQPSEPTIATNNDLEKQSPTAEEKNSDLTLSDQIVCPHCHNLVTANVDFCTECGHSLEQLSREATKTESEPQPCPVCHSPVDAAAIFCTECGHYLGINAKGPGVE